MLSFYPASIVFFGFNFQLVIVTFAIGLAVAMAKAQGGSSLVDDSSSL
jgi:hypothetical protein